jgi:hypothetical protein
MIERSIDPAVRARFELRLARHGVIRLRAEWTPRVTDETANVLLAAYGIPRIVDEELKEGLHEAAIDGERSSDRGGARLPRLLSLFVHLITTSRVGAQYIRLSALRLGGGEELREFYGTG